MNGEKILNQYNNVRTTDDIDIEIELEFDILFREFRYHFYKFLVYKDSLEKKTRQQ